MRQSPCKWIDRDQEGRPRCEHGWAIKNGAGWRCTLRNREQRQRFLRTEAGRESNRRSNASEHAKSSKALYQLTVVR